MQTSQAHPSFRPLIVLDQQLVFERLRNRERELAVHLGDLEERVRNFQDVERIAYQTWIRMEFGPRIMDLERLHEEIEIRRSLARRINDLMERQGLHPREALYVAQAREEQSSSDREEEGGDGEWDADEIRARRQAKREAKRDARREKKREKIQAKRGSPESAQGVHEPRSAPENGRHRLVSLFRALARLLHPDSAVATKQIPPGRALSLWHEVQAAYSESRYDRLVAIAAWLEGRGISDAELGQGSESASMLRDRIRALEKSCAQIEHQIFELARDPAWGFQSLPAGAMRKLRRRIARDLDDQFLQAQDFLEELNLVIEGIGPPRAPARVRTRVPRRG